MLTEAMLAEANCPSFLPIEAPKPHEKPLLRVGGPSTMHGMQCRRIEEGEVYIQKVKGSVNMIHGYLTDLLTGLIGNRLIENLEIGKVLQIFLSNAEVLNLFYTVAK